MTTAPEVVPAPSEGLWWVARGDHPLAPPPSVRGLSTAGANRFDPLSFDVGVLYFGTDLETCFGETLARFRPSLRVLSVIASEWRELGFMSPGTVAADWRQRRSGVHVRLPATAGFLDVESPVTHQFLRNQLALGLSALGLDDLDVAAVRGPDRRVTRLIADWTYMAENQGQPRYAGIRYESRLRTGWECWALFDDEDLELEVLQTLPLTVDMPALQEVARMFELRVF